MPVSIGIAMLAVFLGGNGTALAYALFWRRSPALFWLSSTLIVVGVAYLVLGGPAEPIVRSLWPIPFDDSARGRDLRLRAACEGPRGLATTLMLLPIALLFAVVVLFNSRRLLFSRRGQWICILLAGALGLLFQLLYRSPITEVVAARFFADEVLKVPDHCRPLRSRHP